MKYALQKLFEVIDEQKEERITIVLYSWSVMEKVLEKIIEKLSEFEKMIR